CLVFWAGQAITAAAAVTLLLDPSSGQPQVPAVLLIAALLALALSLTPAANRWVRTAGGAAVQAGRAVPLDPKETELRGSSARQG
ncbi:hypothetical protein ACSTIL_23775, partial [Vibrio parahaemolyticus]